MRTGFQESVYCWSILQWNAYNWHLASDFLFQQNDISGMLCGSGIRLLMAPMQRTGLKRVISDNNIGTGLELGGKRTSFSIACLPIIKLSPYGTHCYGNCDGTLHGSCLSCVLAFATSITSCLIDGISVLVFTSAFVHCCRPLKLSFTTRFKLCEDLFNCPVSCGVS